MATTTWSPAGSQGSSCAGPVTLRACTVTAPPRGIAWLAFNTTFWMACASWPGSASTGLRPGSSSSRSSMGAPPTARCAALSTSGPSAVTRFTGLPPREKVSSCAASFAERRSASSRSPRSGTVRARERKPKAACSWLLKSCARPPASTPSASSSCARRCVSAARWRSVTSIAMHWKSGSPPTLKGVKRTSSTIGSPLRFAVCHSKAWEPFSSALTMFSCTTAADSRPSGWYFGAKSSGVLPSTSATLSTPNIFTVAGLHDTQAAPRITSTAASIASNRVR